MIERAGWTLIHFLWQGALIAALLEGVLALMPRARAATRYAMACLAMAAMLCAPVVTFVWLAGGSSPASLTSSASQLVAAGSPVVNPAVNIDGANWGTVERWFPVLIGLWLTGVLVLSARLAGGLLVVRRLRSQRISQAQGEWQAKLAELARKLGIRRVVELYESAMVEVPTVVGWLRPVILLPASALTQLTPGQLEALLAHELAHIRRHDYLVNLVQALVETLLFYHPAVWWTSRRVRVEREHCCDDVAVAVSGGDVVAYAKALARLEEVREIRPRTLEFALGADGGSLVERVRRLLLKNTTPNQKGVPWLAGLVALGTALAVGSAMVTFAPRADAQDQRPQAEPAPKAMPGGQEQTPDPKAKPSPYRAPRAAASADGAESEAPEAEAAEAPEAEEAQQPADAVAPQAAGSAKPAGSFMTSLEAAGYKDLDFDKLIAFKIHGVDADYIRQIKAAGFNPTPDQLLSMRIHGVTPQFAAEMKGAGYPNLTIDQLVACRIHNVNPKTVEELKQLGFGSLSIDDAMSARIHGVKPEFVKSLKDAGFNGLSFDQVVSARIHGLSPALVQALRQAGFDKLQFDDVIGARIHGVTPEFIAEVKRRGFQNLTLEKVIQLKQFRILE